MLSDLWGANVVCGIVTDSDTALAAGQTRTRVKLDESGDFAQKSIRLLHMTDDGSTNPGDFETAWIGGTQNGWWVLDSNYGSNFTGSPYAVGETTVLDNEGYTIRSIETSEELTRKIVCSPYSEKDFIVSADVGEPTFPGLRKLVKWKTAGGSPSPVEDGSAALTLSERIILNPDGTPRLAVDLSWNPPTLDSDEDWNSTDSPLPNRQLAFPLNNYEIYWREDGEADASVWRFAGVTRIPEFTVQEGMTPGTDIEFSVLAVTSDGERYHPNDGETATITLSDGLNGVELSVPDVPGLAIRALPYGFPEAEIRWTSTNAESVTGDLPGQFEIRQGKSWLAGQEIGRVQGTNISLPAVMPNGTNKILCRSKTRAGVYSATAAEVSQPTNLPKEYTVQADREAGQDDSWGGTKTNLAIHADGYLYFSGSDAAGTYVTDGVDGGNLTGQERRVLYVEAQIDILSTVDFNSTAKLGDSAANRTTFEGEVDGEPIALKLYTSDSSDDATWSDWTEVRGPIESEERYSRAKIELTRSDTSQEIRIQTFRILAVG